MNHFRILLPALLMATASACTIVLKLYPTVEAANTSDVQQINGGRLRAAWLAASDLVQQVEKNQKSAPKQNEIMLCFARVESYDLEIREANDRYVVELVPRSERCVTPPSRLMGGGATYEIDKITFNILSQAHAE